MKTNIKIIVALIIGVILSTFFSCCFAETLINSKDVYYKDNSNLLADNVQDAIDGTCTKFDNSLTNLKKEMLNEMYPVGSVYISTTLETVKKVQAALGGEWEVYGNGRVLRGIDSGDAGATGGSETTTLLEENLPSHRHSIPSLSGTTEKAGNHTHSLTALFSPNVYGKVLVEYNGFAMALDGGRQTFTIRPIDYAGEHTHSLTTVADNTGYVGSGTAFSTLDPYITVYMYRRTK